jgi:hypothetical protein
MIVILCEEPSMKAILESLINRYFQSKVKGLDWFIFKYSGKSDLERNIVHKMKTWSYGTPKFIILRDADGGNCRDLKKHLSSLAAQAGDKPYKVRIVCQELESWLIGDAQAIEKSYCWRIESQKAKFLNPDRLTNASEELSKITGDRTKELRARKIAPYLIPDRNKSHSFQVFYKTLGEFFDL